VRSGGWCWCCVAGAVCLLFDSQRRFLRLRAGLRRIRWVAQFGGAWLGRVGGRRLCGGSESQTHGEGPAPPAGALQRGAGRGRVVRRRPLLVVAFVPDPSSLSSPGGNQPVLAVSSRITAAVVRHRPAGHRQDGLVVQAPPTATRDPGPPHLWEGFPAPRARHLAAACAHQVDPVHTTGVVSRIPRRCRRAKPSWPGRWCPAGRSRTTAAVMRLDTTGPACFR